MKTQLELDITQKDCDEGCRGTERYCVIATAIERLVPDATRIEVNVNTVRFTIKEDGKTYRYAYPSPDAVRDYIKAFDAGAKAQSAKFVLDNPQIVEKAPTPKGRAVTPSFKPSSPAKTRRSVRVFGEKAWQS